jgi:hypothetical protein
LDNWGAHQRGLYALFARGGGKSLGDFFSDLLVTDLLFFVDDSFHTVHKGFEDTAEQLSCPLHLL